MTEPQVFQSVEEAALARNYAETNGFLISWSDTALATIRADKLKITQQAEAIEAGLELERRHVERIAEMEALAPEVEQLADELRLLKDGRRKSASTHGAFYQALAVLRVLNGEKTSSGLGKTLAEISQLRDRIADLEEVLEDKRRNARLLDIALNGEAGAARQASLCDLISQVRGIRAFIAGLSCQKKVAQLGWLTSTCWERGDFRTEWCLPCQMSEGK